VPPQRQESVSMKSKKPYILYIMALLLFGSNGIVASHIHLASCDIVLLRTMTGSLLLLFLFRLKRCHFQFPGYWRDCLYICLSGAAMGAGWMFLFEAYTLTGVGIASLLYYCGPVIVMALSPLLFKEKLTAVRLIGFAAVLCGVFLINENVTEKPNTSGILCGLLSAVMYAFMVMANKKAKHIAGLENALIQLISSFLTVAAFTAVKNRGIGMRVMPGDWIWILMLGLLNTGIGCYLYFSSIGSLPVQTVAVCGYIEPLSAVVLSALLLGETMAPLQILGVILIIGGAAAGAWIKQDPYGI